MAATSEQRYATEATASLASIVLYVGVLMILEILSMRLPGGENRRLHSAGKFTGTTLHPTLSQINPKRQVFESFSCEFRVCRNDDLPPTGLSDSSLSFVVVAIFKETLNHRSSRGGEKRKGR